MDELEILIQAILSLKDTTKSKQQILSELPKLQQQLQSDKNAKININAGLDINKSKSLIQTQLNQLASQIRIPNISTNINTIQSTHRTQSQSTKAQNEGQRKLNESLTKQISSSKEIPVLKNQIAAYQTANPQAVNHYQAEFNSLKNSLLSAKTPEEVDKLRAKFATLKSEIKVAGKEGNTFWQKMEDSSKKFSKWFSISSIVMYLANDIRKMVTTVFELDTAMNDLQKTCRGTTTDLKDFYYEANDIAKQLGVTTAEVINSASSWSRLGYNTKEAAAQMAKAVSIMKTVSPNMSTDTANEGLISIIKAFDEINTDNIVDKDMETTMDSVSDKVNEVKETLTEISQDTTTQDFLKSIIDNGITIIETFSEADPVLLKFLNILSDGVTGVTDFANKTSTLFAGLLLKNVGELIINTPSYASLLYCA